MGGVGSPACLPCRPRDPPSRGPATREPHPQNPPARASGSLPSLGQVSSCEKTRRPWRPCVFSSRTTWKAPGAPSGRQPEVPVGRRYCPRAGRGRLGGGAAWGGPGERLWDWPPGGPGAALQSQRAICLRDTVYLAAAGERVQSPVWGMPLVVELNEHGAGWAPKTGLPGKY